MKAEVLSRSYHSDLGKGFLLLWRSPSVRMGAIKPCASRESKSSVEPPGGQAGVTPAPHAAASQEARVTYVHVEGRGLGGWGKRSAMVLSGDAAPNTITIAILWFDCPFPDVTWKLEVTFEFFTVLILDVEKNKLHISIHYYPPSTKGRLRNEWQGCVSFAPVKLCTWYEMPYRMTARRNWDGPFTLAG